MKYFKNFPAIGLYAYLSYMSIFIVAGGWHFFVGLFFDFKYIRVVKNLSLVMTSILIIWIMKTYFKRTFVVFYNSVKQFKRSLVISLTTLIIVFFSYAFSIFLFNYSGIVFITINPDFWGTFNSIAKSLLAGVTVAIGEEIVYRGFLFNAIYHKIKKRTMAIIVTSFFFSISHFYYNSVLDFIIAFWCGIILCVLYIKYKSLYPSIFFHFGWNFSYIFFSLIRNHSTVENNPLISLEFSGFLDQYPEIIELLILLIMSFFLVIFLRKEVISYLKKIRKVQTKP